MYTTGKEDQTQKMYNMGGGGTASYAGRKTRPMTAKVKRTPGSVSMTKL
jgi:hypothetical protein